LGAVPPGPRSPPVQIGALPTGWAVGGQGDSTMALTRNGGLYAWALNTSGQLGDGKKTSRSSPVTTGLNNTWVGGRVGTTNSLGLVAV